MLNLSLVIDGEAVVLDEEGIADFNVLQSRRHDARAWLYAFDILALDGDDLRGLPLSSRKTSLALLLRGRPDGIFVVPFEQGEIGPDLFRAACRMGLEGMVSNRADRPYRATPPSRALDLPVSQRNRGPPALQATASAGASTTSVSSAFTPACRSPIPTDEPAVTRIVWLFSFVLGLALTAKEARSR